MGANARSERHPAPPVRAGRQPGGPRRGCGPRSARRRAKGPVQAISAQHAAALERAAAALSAATMGEAARLARQLMQTEEGARLGAAAPADLPRVRGRADGKRYAVLPAARPPRRCKARCRRYPACWAARRRTGVTPPRRKAAGIRRPACRAGCPSAHRARLRAAMTPAAEMMQRALPVLGAIMQSGQGAVRQEKRALLGALKPFVTPEVAGQFDHALRLVSMGAHGARGHGTARPAGAGRRSFRSDGTKGG